MDGVDHAVFDLELGEGVVDLLQETSHMMSSLVVLSRPLPNRYKLEDSTDDVMYSCITVYLYFPHACV